MEMSATLCVRDTEMAVLPSFKGQLSRGEKIRKTKYTHVCPNGRKTAA